VSKAYPQGGGLMLDAVKRLQLAIRVATDAALLSINLTLTQAHALSTLASTGPLPCAALARRLGITRQSMQELVTTLHGRRLLTKRLDPDDARHIVVELSELGEGAARNADKIMREVETRMAGGLSSADRRQFLDALAICLANLGRRALGDASAGQRPPSRTANSPRPHDGNRVAAHLSERTACVAR
jgi:DNA-binding MarR family transcriptional regulator